MLTPPRLQADMPCRYRRITGTWCYYWSPLLDGNCQTCRRDVATGTIVRCVLPGLVGQLSSQRSSSIQALGHDDTVGVDGSATRATQLARGVVAAAQLCFTTVQCRARLRSLFVNLIEDIDANVIHWRLRGEYDLWLSTQSRCAASRGRELLGFSEPGGHAKEKGSIASSIATTVDRVPRSSVHMWSPRVAVCVVALLQQGPWCAHSEGTLRSDRSAWPRDRGLHALTCSIRS